MKEKEWLASKAPRAMLQHVCDRFGVARRKGGRRKPLLLACACARRVWHRLTEDSDRNIVLLAEEYADGVIPYEQLELACGRARQPREPSGA